MNGDRERRGPGQLQVDFLHEQGLHPAHRFIEIGCGSIRVGSRLVRFLDAGNYFGVDAYQSRLQAGYDQLDEEQRAKLPIGNLRATDRFDVDFGIPFDMGLARSLSVHRSLNEIRLCLYRVAKSMRPGGRLFAPFFERRAEFPIDGIVEIPHRLHGEQQPYWYYRGDLEWAARRSSWEPRYIGDWGSPGGQKMMEFIRLAV